MTKVRCGDNLGINLEEVIVWKRLETSKCEPFLLLYLNSSCDSVQIFESAAGSQAFALLHKSLLDRFAIDLSSEIASKVAGDRLEDLPY